MFWLLAYFSPSHPRSGPEEISASWHPLPTSAKWPGLESPVCFQFVLVESPLLPKILGSRDFPEILFNKYTEGIIHPECLLFSSHLCPIFSTLIILEIRPPFVSPLRDLIHLRALATNYHPITPRCLFLAPTSLPSSNLYF